MPEVFIFGQKEEEPKKETYTTVSGDTWPKISRKVYGHHRNAILLVEANPSVAPVPYDLLPTTELPSGLEIITPKFDEDVSEVTTAPLEKPGQTFLEGPRFLSDPPPPKGVGTDVVVTIGGVSLNRLTDISIIDSIDVFSTFEFVSPFDSSSAQMRRIFRPFSFQPVVVSVGGVRKFTGTLISVEPEFNADESVVRVVAYSKPAALNDCTSSSSAFPLQFKTQKIGDIAGRLGRMFGISLRVNGDMGNSFEDVSLEADKPILPFIIELATQRNMMLSNTRFGHLLIHKAATAGAPVQRISSFDSLMAAFDEQNFYSDITGLQSHSSNYEDGKWTAKNPHLKLDNVFRPLIYKVPDSETGDLKDIVEGKMARMIGNSVSYSLTLPGWLDASGNLWRPNTTVRVIAPDAMIYRETEFLIRKVELEKTSRIETAHLELVLPGTFSGVIPEVLPWQ